MPDLLPSNRTRRAAEIDSSYGIEKEKPITHAFPEHDEALSCFFFGQQHAVLVGMGKKENVIRRRHFVSFTAGSYKSERHKRRLGRNLANFSLFRMHVDKQYRNDFAVFQEGNNME